MTNIAKEADFNSYHFWQLNKFGNILPEKPQPHSQQRPTDEVSIAEEAYIFTLEQAR